MNIDTKNRPATQDWPNSKIKMHLEDAGWTLRRLSVARGYSPCAAAKALHQPVTPPLERIIADAIGVDPSVIWPTRYPGGVRAPSYILRRAAKNTTSHHLCKNKPEETPR
ncbi:MAG: helix-turn-helix domain-containing protein [Magnetococcales bacterium]|nr:helix-turn-helix domain-containing protein [Magnetococcales bacterium]